MYKLSFNCFIAAFLTIFITLSLYCNEVNCSQQHLYNQLKRFERDLTLVENGQRIRNTDAQGLSRSGKYICLEDEDDRDRLIQWNKKKEIHCKCPKMYAPVCGNDGNTYHNRCFMQCYSDFKYQGFSRENNVKLQVVKWGPCDNEHLLQPQQIS